MDGGVEDGPSVMLLHGIPGSGREWSAAAAELMTTHRVLVPDLLGFGASERPSSAGALWADSQARAIGEVLDRLRIGRIAVVGHDFGGPVALSLLRDGPERVSRLALVSCNVFPDTPVPFPLSAVTWPVVGRPAARLLFSAPSLRAMIRRGTADRSAAADPADVVGDRGQQRSVRLIFATALRSLSSLYSPFEALLGDIRAPTLVAWGDHDPFFGVDQGRRTAAAIPGARFVLHEGAGHFLPRERARGLAADIAELVSLSARAEPGVTPAPPP